MVEYAPATGGLGLWALHRDVTDQRLIISTDGVTIFYAPEFSSRSIEEQTGLVAHAVLHVALRHPQRRTALHALTGDVDPDLFRICADAIVNSTLDHLSWLSLPRGSVKLDVFLNATLAISEPVEKSLLEWDVERLYRAVDDRGPSRGGTRGREGNDPERIDGPRATAARALGADTIDDLSSEDAAQTADTAPEREADAERSWGERISRAHAGDGTFSMLRTLMADLPSSRVPWRQMLRRLAARALTPVPDLSWSRPTRSYLANQGKTPSGKRLPFEPGRTPTRTVPSLAVIVDVSGSVEDAVLQRFAAEVDAISRRTGAAVTLIVGDEIVRSVSHPKPGHSGLDAVSFEGGGGTDFTPLLEEADRHRPDLGIVLTDLDGPARFEPNWPVLWAVPIADRHRPAPFGRKLVID
jgi:predicted metal-dependent peptidase